MAAHVSNIIGNIIADHGGCTCVQQKG